ncbi:CSC1-like protein [Vitis vinifera]|uniref:CSC1-like protein n=1 Tax=Vitis vinifera TaxID=29760 RepID=A0A438HYK2_VITVI|nr:CSC1-like protein [Vitis vinifera]
MLTYAWRMFSDVKHFLRINCQKLFLTAKVLWIVSTYKLIMLIQNMHLYQGVVVRNVPHVSGHSISDTVDHFFQTNHPNHYIDHQAVYNANKYSKLVRKRERVRNWLDYNKLKFERHPDRRPTTKIGFLGICGKRVDSIEYYEQQIKEIDKRIALERQRILKDPKSIMPVAFVSFNSRWGAAVCAQTQQSRNPTLWLTNWAPEPRDVYWQNLAIPFVSLSIRKLIVSLTCVRFGVLLHDTHCFCAIPCKFGGS